MWIHRFRGGGSCSHATPGRHETQHCPRHVPDSRVASVSNFNGTSTTYMWDKARRPQEILHQDGTQTLSDHAYTLDALGNRIHFSEQLPVISGLMPSMADAAVAHELQNPSADTTMDAMVAATTEDAPHPLAQGTGPRPTPPPAPPSTGRPN